MFLLEHLQGRQGDESPEALNLRIKSVECAQNSSHEQMDAVHHRMRFLEEENVQVKASVAQLTENLQSHQGDAPRLASGIVVNPEVPLVSDVPVVLTNNTTIGQTQVKK
jgi:hypothetical protein